VLRVIVTIPGGIYAVLTVSVTIMGWFICSVSSYFDNSEEVYMQC
jgi:hypothetical protein